MSERTIAVVGCGPAGLAAALLLHRDGHRATLFERFEAPRPIGSGLMLQPTGLAVLDALGLRDRTLAAGARIDRLLGRSVPSGRAVLDVGYASLGGGRFGVGIHRATLFAILHDAVRRAAIPIVTARPIAGSRAVAGGRLLLGEDGSADGPFDLVVDASGAGTRLAPATGRALAYGALWATLDWPDGAGFDPAALEQRYRRADRMVGVLPIGMAEGDRRRAAFFWSLRADALDRWRTAGLDAWKREVTALWPATIPLLDQIVDPGQLTFARYAHRTVARPAADRLVHVGDAWHSASPQLGQGANMALLDAWALARALRIESDIDRALALAIASRRRHVRLYQAMTALFTPVYQSDGRLIPLVRDRLVAPLSRLAPARRLQAAMVAGLVGRPLRGLDLG